MKSLKKQAVFPVLMLLVVTALALIGSSFAWFSISNSAKVTAFDATAQAAGTGIAISDDADTYQAQVDVASAAVDGTTAISALLPATLKTVSTASLTTDATGLLSFYKAEIQSVGATTKVTSTADDSGVTSTSGLLAASGTPSYIAFDLFFMIDTSVTNYVDLYLNTGSQVIYIGSDGSANIVKAVRVAFVNMGNTAVKANASALAGDSKSVLIWQPVAAADANASYYGISGAGSNFDAYIASAYSTQITTNKTNDDLVLASNETVSGETPVATISAGYNKIRVYVWLEGNDVDCINAVASSNIQVTLNFFGQDNGTSVA